MILFIATSLLGAAPMRFCLPGDELPGVLPRPAGIADKTPASNAIGDIEFNAETGDVWISTGNGLSVSRDGGTNWENKLDGYGFSALSVLGDWVIAAASFDTVVNDPTDPLPVGDGFFISFDRGETFERLDSLTDEDLRHVCRIGQIAYDVALVPEGPDTGIYAACFYGGILYSSDRGANWENVIPNGDDTLRYSSTDLDHRFFSIAADTSAEPPLIWAGSAKGLFAGHAGDFAWVWHDVDGRWIPDSVPVYDTTWVDSVTFEVDSVSDFYIEWNADPACTSAISGEWIISIDFRYGGDTTGVFASTRSTGSDGGYDAISYSFSDGVNWSLTGDGYVAWNMGFACDKLWAACTHGLSRFDRPDYTEGDTIEIAGHDLLTGLQTQILVDEVVSVTDCNGRIFVGTYSEGLAMTDNCGETWSIIGRFAVPGEGSNDPGESVYAYPNPFSPNRHGGCFFVFEYENPEENVKIEVFDYDIRKVVTVFDGSNFDKDGGWMRVQWDGTLTDGRYPANGLYFFRIKNGDRERWGKLMIIK